MAENAVEARIMAAEASRLLSLSPRHEAVERRGTSRAMAQNKISEAARTPARESLVLRCLLPALHPRAPFPPPPPSASAWPPAAPDAPFAPRPAGRSARFPKQYPADWYPRSPAAAPVR